MQVVNKQLHDLRKFRDSMKVAGWTEKGHMIWYFDEWEYHSSGELYNGLTDKSYQIGNWEDWANHEQTPPPF